MPNTMSVEGLLKFYQSGEISPNLVTLVGSAVASDNRGPGFIEQLFSSTVCRKDEIT